MSKISVIIPIYKVEKFLRRCLDSVVSQTYRDLEIILVDDCSPDQCGEICDEYAAKDARIKVIHKPQNEGLSAARNSALKVVSGEWILFVDSDDWCELTLCEKAIAKAEETDADIVMYSLCVNTRKAETPIHAFAKEFVSEDPAFIKQLQLAVVTEIENPMPSEKPWSQGLPWDKLYKASLILGNGLQFAENVRAHEDRIFNVHAFQHARKVCFIDEVLYHWRMNSESIGNRYTPDRAAVDLGVYSEFVSVGQKYGLTAAYYRTVDELLAISTANLGGQYFFNSQNKKPLREKFKEVNEAIHTEPRWSVIQTVDRKRVPQKAKIMLLWRKNPVVMLFLISLISRIKNTRATKMY